MNPLCACHDEPQRSVRGTFVCGVAARAADRGRYQGESRRAYVRKQKDERKAAARQICDDAKAGGCSGCGLIPSDLRVLIFHHRNAAAKVANVSKLVMWAGRSWQAVERVRREVAKCDVVCPTCHAIAHLTGTDPAGVTR